MWKNMTTEYFVKKAKERFGDFYDYGNTRYRHPEKVIVITCQEHGDWMTYPVVHLRHSKKKAKCPLCKVNTVYNHRGRTGKSTKTLEQFISDCRDCHGDTYDYSLVKEYIYHKKIKIICKEHGIFEQLPNNHLSGHGCKKCAYNLGIVGKNEKKYFQPWIKELFPTAHLQYEFSDLPYIVDAYIPEYGLVIEYDEKEHKYRKKYDNHRQDIIEENCGVTFYRINDLSFLEEKYNHEQYLKDLTCTNQKLR
jgi:very-short-patch-repair endonuclease